MSRLLNDTPLAIDTTDHTVTETMAEMVASEVPHASRRQFLKTAATAGFGMLALPGFLQGAAKAKGTVKKSDPACNPKNPNQACPKDGTGGLATQVVATLQAKSFDHLNGTIEGLSWNQIQQHLGLYTGYVKKLNELQAQMAANTAQANFDRVRDIQLAQSYALNGAVLHDLYFSNLAAPGSTPGKLTTQLITRDFGTQAAYLAELKAIAGKMRGWAMTGLSLLDGKIRNYGLDMHDQGTPMWVYPLLVLDVYEHAYMIDFGTNRGAYLEAFLKNIDWTEVESRLTFAAHSYNRGFGQTGYPHLLAG